MVEEGRWRREEARESGVRECGSETWLTESGWVMDYEWRAVGESEAVMEWTGKEMDR